MMKQFVTRARELRDAGFLRMAKLRAG